MNKLIITLLLVCLSDFLPDKTFALNRYKLDQLNDYLTKTVPTDDATSNYKAAVSWLHQLNRDADKELKSVLKIFIATKSLIDDKSCNPKSKRIAEDACNFIGSCSSEIKLITAKRVSSLVLSSVRSHATSCEYMYPKIYVNLVRSLPVSVARKVDEIGHSLGVLLLQHKGFNEFNQVFNGHADTAISFVRSVYELLFDKNLINTLSRMIANRSYSDKCADLYDNLLLRPCKEYVKLLGADLFDLAEYDSVVREENQLNDSSAMKSFYPAWLRHNICRQVINSRDTWIKQLKQHGSQDGTSVC